MLLLVWHLASPAASRADVLTGTIVTRVRAGATPATAVVYAEPLSGSAPARTAGPFPITQRNKTFTPRVLGVPVGAVVQFPNEDGLFHNVFSLSPGHAFDLGLYRSGASKSRTFATAGVVRVFCNIHPQMTALVVVARTPWIVNAGADGAFRLDLPPGRYTADHAVGTRLRRVGRGRGVGRHDGAVADPRRKRVRGRAARQQVRQAVSGGGLQAAVTNSARPRQRPVG